MIDMLMPVQIFCILLYAVVHGSYWMDVLWRMINRKARLPSSHAPPFFFCQFPEMLKFHVTYFLW